MYCDSSDESASSTDGATVRPQRFLRCSPHRCDIIKAVEALTFLMH